LIETTENSKVLKEKVLLVGLYGPETTRWEAQEHLNELERLTSTAGGASIGRNLQNRRQPDPSTYVGSGKLKELKQQAGQSDADIIIFDDDLSPTQIRNIEQTTQTKVLDRSGLILDIFAARAQTAAAKTQVELAQLQYLLPRLTRFWTHLSRQKGGIGTKGPGETQIETDRRLIGQRIATLKKKLDKLEVQRHTQHKGRSKFIRIALVGYTNAGKSTLMNTLTETDVLAEDQLFATLDSTVRRETIGKQQILFSDTVGFIRKLPHNLIESFKSTLNEVREADILLHVIDASSPMNEDYIRVVNNTLKELNAEDTRQIKVFNKIDAIEKPKIRELKNDYEKAVLISAERGIGIDQLKYHIQELIRENYVFKEIEVPVKNYEIVSYIHDVADIINKTYENTTVKLSFNIHKRDIYYLERLIDNIPESISFAESN